MGEAQVVSFDSIVRMIRANTIRSSQYEGKAAALSLSQAERLKDLEDRLFQERRQLTACQTGELNKPVGCFAHATGQISYFFSNKLRKFVFLDFSFDQGGNGGLPIPCDVDPDLSAYPPVYCANEAVHPRRRVAALADVAKRVASWMGRATFRIHDPFAGAGGLPTRSVGDHWAWRCDPDFAAMDLWASALPRWSILNRFLLAPEQLENRFARSILAGELLCRTALESGYAKTMMQSCYEQWSSSDLTRESSYVLAALVGDPVELGAARRLPLATSLRENLLADDCLLSLVRSELAVHLSVYVGIQANQVLGDIDSDHSSYADRYRSVMKKYALLADFVWMSERLFCAGRPTYDQEALRTVYDAHLRGRFKVRTLREIGAFDQSIHAVVSTMIEEDVCDDHVDPDLSVLHAGMLSVTQEILEPLD